MLDGVEGSKAAAATLRAAAGVALLSGVMLGLASWDGLYDALDLPQPIPALLAQAGGAALLGLAWVLWSAASRPPLQDVAAAGATVALGGAALATAGWLLFRDSETDLGVGDLGTAILIGWAVVLALLALALVGLVLAGTRRGQGDQPS